MDRIVCSMWFWLGNDANIATGKPRALIAIALMVLSLSAGGKSFAQVCVPLEPPALTGPGWTDDTAYEIATTPLADGRIRLRVVGDIIQLDPIKFESLVRSVDKAPGNVAEVVFDAREIRVVAPVAFQSAMITLLAHRVVFSGDGALILSRAPSASTDGLSISAYEIDFEKGISLPLQVSIDDKGARKVTIRAESVLAMGKPIDSRGAPAMLWRKSSSFDGLVPSAMPSSWSVDIGATGKDDAIKNISNQAGWPGYFAYKVRKFHRRSPYDSDQMDSLQKTVTAYRPVLVELDQPGPLLDIDATVRLIDEHLNALGVREGTVSSKDLTRALQDFGSNLKALDSAYPGYKGMIMAAYDRPKLDEAKLSAVRQTISDAQDNIDRTRSAITSTFNSLAVIEQQSTTLEGLIEAERQRAAQAFEDKRKKQAENGQNIKLVTTVVAVGASFIGTPAAGAAIAAGVGAAGDIVYAHNAGQPMNVETLVTIAQKNKALYDDVKSSREAWDKHLQDIETFDKVRKGQAVVVEGAATPLTRTQAINALGKSGGVFIDRLKTVVKDRDDLPKPTELQLSDEERSDDTLQAYLAQLAPLTKAHSELTDTLAQLRDTLLADQGHLAEATTVEMTLLEVKPVNDQEILRWKAAALQLWLKELGNLYADATSLRRSLFFETWKTPALPPDVMQYPEEMGAYLQAGRYDPQSPSGATPSKLTGDLLDAEYARHKALLTSIQTAVKRSLDQYRDERAGGAQPYSATTPAFIRGPGAPPATIEFIEHLNAQLKRQATYAKPGVREMPLLIPVTFSTPPLDQPERLVDLGISNVKFVDERALTGKTVSLVLRWRLSGELVRNGTCAFVSITVPGGDQYGTRSIETRTYTEPHPQGVPPPLSFQELNATRTAAPARTLYYLSVLVSGSREDANWKNVPEIKELTFWRRVVQ